MSKITKENEVLIKAKVLDHLIEHLQKRTDVQNIDLKISLWGRYTLLLSPSCLF